MLKANICGKVKWRAMRNVLKRARYESGGYELERGRGRPRELVVALQLGRRGKIGAELKGLTTHLSSPNS